VLTQKLEAMCALNIEEIVNIELPLGLGQDEPISR
jgi:hypothetical protein